jgi:WD40 repeat protein
MANVRMNLTKTDLTLQLGSRDRESEFTVTVTNQSERFVSFKPKLSIRELNQTAENDWYRIEPSFCAKKPPGDTTEFKITIVKPPLKIYDATIDIDLEVFAIEDPQICAKDLLRLTIKSSELPLKLLLPIKNLKVLPGEELEIPIFLYNLTSNIIDVNLEISAPGLQANWFKFKNSQFGEAKKFAIESAQDREEVCVFYPPKNPQEILREKYQFKVNAKNDDFPTSISGTIEILPQGEVEFQVREKRLHPANFLLKSFRNRRTYLLSFKNNSNLKQQAILDRQHITEAAKRKFSYQLDEGEIILSPGEEKNISLTIWKKRTWLILLRFTYRLQLTISPILIDPESGKLSPSSLHPESQVVNLPMFLVVQFAIQILLLIASIGLWWFSPQFGDRHQSSVNAVRFNRDASTVVSGSSDRTLRRWQVDKTSWPEHHRLKDRGTIWEEINLNGTEIEQPNHAIQTIRATPNTLTQNNIFVMGLENGEIQLWDINKENLLTRLYFVDDRGEVRNNRIFGIHITNNSFFTSHGSNTVYQWDLNSILNSIETVETLPLSIPINEKKPQNPLMTPIYSQFVPLTLAVSEKNNFLVLAGRYNKLAFWRFGDNTRKIRYEGQFYFKPENTQNSNQEALKPILGQQSYITSLAIAESGQHQTLAMSDNNGYITLWDLKKIDRCIAQYSDADKNTDEIQTIPLQECEAIIAQWSDGHQGQPVRSLAMTPNGCYLASTGDDGQVKLWLLDEEGKRDEKILGEFPQTRLNSVDIKEDKNYLWVVSDAASHRIQLYRTSIKTNNEERCPQSF